MEGNHAANRRFIKFMMPGFHQKMNLPPAFCEKLEEEKSKRAIVKSCRGTWNISISRNHDGIICFEDGWPIFVHQHGLNIGDFVLFEHTGDMQFNAFVFDPSACEKEFLVEVKNEHKEEPEPVNSEKKPAKKESGTQYSSQKTHFIITMQPYHASKSGKVSIPAEFSRSNNITRMKTVTLRDPRGKTWDVKLLHSKDGPSRCRMDRGWHEFYVSNKLKEGDVCDFDLKCSSKRATNALMDVKIFRARI